MCARVYVQKSPSCYIQIDWWLDLIVGIVSVLVTLVLAQKMTVTKTVYWLQFVIYQMLLSFFSSEQCMQCVREEESSSFKRFHRLRFSLHYVVLLLGPEVLVFVLVFLRLLWRMHMAKGGKGGVVPLEVFCQPLILEIFTGLESLRIDIRSS